jgi:hypothetical protein
VFKQTKECVAWWPTVAPVNYVHYTPLITFEKSIAAVVTLLRIENKCDVFRFAIPPAWHDAFSVLKSISLY